MIRVSDLPHSDKVKYLDSEDATVAHVVSIKEEAAPAADAEAAAGATPSEPEVAKKGKTEPWKRLQLRLKKPEAGAKK